MSKKSTKKGELRESYATADKTAAGLQAKTAYPLQLAVAYVPWQNYGAIFSPEEALEKGTLFPDLYRPYSKMA